MNVLLDLDGTLTDPRVGFVASINHALVSLGLAAAPEPVVASCIGPPLEETLTLLLGAGNEHQLPAAVALYRDRYSERGIFECSMYEGIPELLRQLKDNGHRLFLATSKPRVFAARILEHFGLDTFFSGIYGAELDGTNADKRLLLAHLLTQEGLDPAASVMVGDRLHDIREARANGVASIGVLWGYGSREELQQAGAGAIVESPGGLAGELLSGHAADR